MTLANKIKKSQITQNLKLLSNLIANVLVSWVQTREKLARAIDVAQGDLLVPKLPLQPGRAAVYFCNV